MQSASAPRTPQGFRPPMEESVAPLPAGGEAPIAPRHVRGGRVRNGAPLAESRPEGV